MSLWPSVLMLFLALAVVLIAIAGKPRWDTYTKMAQLRPEERVLFEEKKVRIKSKAWAAFPWYDWTYAGGGPVEYGWLTAQRVVITNERILAFAARNVPTSVVDFTRQESLPSSWWLPFRQCYLMNVAKDDIRVATDESGRPCLEVQYEGRKGHGIRTRYYLRDFEIAKQVFVQGDPCLVHA